MSRHLCRADGCEVCENRAEQIKAERDEPLSDRECDALENAYEKANGW